jgi:hypothetical protein
MLLQTNSYIVPRDKRMEHARLLRKFRQTLIRLGCDHFEVFEQVGQNWNSQDTTGRFVQLMKFRDRRHQLEVQAAERSDPTAQALIREFCELVNFPYQQQEGLFAVGYYVGFMRTPPTTQLAAPAAEAPAAESAAVEIPVQEEVVIQDESPPDELPVQEETPAQEEFPAYEETALPEEPIVEAEPVAAVDLFADQSEALTDETVVAEEATLPAEESTEQEQVAESNGEHIAEEPAAEEAPLEDLTAEDPALEALFSSDEAPVSDEAPIEEIPQPAHETGGNGQHHTEESNVEESQHAEGGNGDALVPSNGDHHAEGNGDTPVSETVENNDAPADQISTSAMDSVFGEQVPADRITPATEDDAFDIHGSESATGSGSEQLKGNY